MAYIREDSSAPYGMAVYGENGKQDLLDNRLSSDPTSVEHDKARLGTWTGHKQVRVTKLRDSFDRKIAELGDMYDSAKGIDIDTLDIWIGTKGNASESDNDSSRTRTRDPFANADSALDLVTTICNTATDNDKEQLVESVMACDSETLATDIVTLVIAFARDIVRRERSTGKANNVKANVKGLKELGWSKEQLLALVGDMFNDNTDNDNTDNTDNK